MAALLTYVTTAALALGGFVAVAGSGGPGFFDHAPAPDPATDRA